MYCGCVVRRRTAGLRATMQCLCDGTCLYGDAVLFTVRTHWWGGGLLTGMAVRQHRLISASLRRWGWGRYSDTRVCATARAG